MLDAIAIDIVHSYVMKGRRYWPDFVLSWALNRFANYLYRTDRLRQGTEYEYNPENNQ